MDNFRWFKFSPSDWMMGRIQRQPAQVQVDFLRLCCKYWQKDCDLSIDDGRLEAMDSYDALLKYRIVTELDGNVRIAFLDEQMDGINAKREQASEAGKRSAAARKRLTESNDRSTTVQRDSTDKSRVDKRREEKIRKEKEEEALPPAPPHKLIEWIDTNAPRIQQLKQPLTNEEAERIMADLTIDTPNKKQRLRDLLMAMHNYKPLLTKSVSANLTIRKWWKSELERSGEIQKPTIIPIKMNTETYNR